LLLASGLYLLPSFLQVDYFKAHGTITGKTEVSLKPVDGSAASTITANNIIIATGSVPATLPGLDVDEKQIVTSTGALDLKEIPKTMVVVGGGVIGLEMGSVWSRLGTKVIVVEYLDRIIPGTDNEVRSRLLRTGTRNPSQLRSLLLCGETRR
jgi:dihydrolipoamide dehydrogenase